MAADVVPPPAGFAPEGTCTRSDVAPLGLSGLCLGMYAFLLPIQISIGSDLRLAPSDAFLLAYVLIRLSRFTTPRFAWSVWHAVILFSLSIGAVVTALQGDLSFYVVVQKGIGVLTLYLAYASVVDFCRSLDRVVWLCQVFLWGVLLNLIVALVALYGANAGLFDLSFVNFEGVRLAGFLVDPNAFGGLLATAVALHFLPAAADVRLLPRNASRVMSIALPVGLVLTFSRSAWIGAAGVILTGAWLFGYPLVRNMAKLGGAFVVVLLVATAAVLPHADTLVKRGDQVESRFSILSQASEDFSTNPITGIGLGESIERHGVQIHNTTVAFLVELGPFGLIALIGLLSWFASHAFRISRSRDRIAHAIGGGLLAAHVGMFGVSLGIDAFYQRHWWLILGLIGAMVAIAEPARGPTAPHTPAFAHLTSTTLSRTIQTEESPTTRLPPCPTK